MEIKCQLDATEVFIADLIACSTCSGHHYAHHQEPKTITQWLLPVVCRAVKMQIVICKLGGICVLSIKCRVLSGFVIRCIESTKYHRQQPLYNTLELLMMGTVVPETF